MEWYLTLPAVLPCIETKTKCNQSLRCRSAIFKSHDTLIQSQSKDPISPVHTGRWLNTPERIASLQQLNSW